MCEAVNITENSRPPAASSWLFKKSGITKLQFPTEKIMRVQNTHIFDFALKFPKLFCEI